MKRLLRYVPVLSVLLGSALTAGDAGRESLFIHGSGARALGMGGAFTALSNDAGAVYYNPAGLGSLDLQEVSFSHEFLFEKTSYDVASWVYPIGEQAGLGFGVMRLGTGDLERRENFINTGSFGYSTWQGLLSYGRRLEDHISLGLSIKLVSQTMDSFSDFGIGGDLGFKAHIYRGLNLGLTVHDAIPAELKLDSIAESTPLSVTAGLALRDVRIRTGVMATLAADVEAHEDRSARVHAGLELVALEQYRLRLGYDRDNLTFGAGLQQKKFRVDYAFKLLDELPESHRFTLSLSLGESVAQSRIRQQREAEDRAQRLIVEERERQLLQFKATADEFYRQLRLDSALTYYQRALAFDANNTEIIGTIAAIENIKSIQAAEERKIREAQADLRAQVQAYYDQARVFVEKKYFPAARDLLRLTLDIDPVHEPSLRLLSQVRQLIDAEIMSLLSKAREAELTGHPLEAIEAYNRVAELDTANVSVREARRKAVATLDLAQQRSLGVTYFQQGRMAEARQQFEAVLRAQPGDAVALDYLARMEQRPSPTATTLEDLQNDRAVWPLYLDGLRYMRNKEYQKAIESWEQVLRVYPNSSNTIENIKQARLRMTSEGGGSR